VNTLILMCGLPRSGKTTIARKMGHPIVNPDSIRRALHGHRYVAQSEPYVWAIAKTMVESLFMAGHETVVVDATNTTEKRRDFWNARAIPVASKQEEFPKEAVFSFPVWKRYVYFVDTDPEECMRRASEQRDYEIQPVIERMAAQFEYPEEIEAYSITRSCEPEDGWWCKRSATS